ncbi:dihydrodipicolinate synthase [compost metagenome]
MAPKTCVALVEAAAQRRWDEVQQIWTSLAPVMSLIWQGDYVQSVYAGAEIMGYGAGNPRRPLARLPDDKQQALREALAPLIEREAASR